MEARKLPSGSWRCQVFDRFEEIPQADGTIKKKRIYKSFTCADPSRKGKRKCEQMAMEWAANKENETVSSEDMPFGEALAGYISLKKPVLSPASIRGYNSISRVLNSECPQFCSKMVFEITQEDVQKAVNKLSSGRSPKHIQNIHGLISATMRQYRPAFVLRTSLPKKVRPNLYIPSDDDVKRLMACVQGTDMELPILLAAFGPMRRGEICALDAKNISGSVVHVCENMILDTENNWIIKTPKSYAGDRYIDYPEFVAEKWKGSTGRIVKKTPSSITTSFRRILLKNDLPEFRFHDLRHYSASIQHALGIPDSYIMARGGWENDTVLKSIYRHAMSDQTKKMNSIANQHFESLCNTKCNTK